MTPYLTVNELKTLITVPSSHVDRCEEVAPGYVASQLVYWSGYIDSRLRKRYAVPFAEPSATVRGWLARMVTPRLEVKIGVRPTDQQFAWIEADAKGAFDELAEAADAEKGLYDLPLLGDAGESGLGERGSKVYSEQSPYVGFDVQADIARAQDDGRGGSTR